MTINTSRVDLYRVIHKALRAMLFDLALTAGRTDYDDPAALDVLRESFAALTRTIREHTEHEERHVAPLVVACAPELAESLAECHGDHATELSWMQAQVDRIDPQTPGAREAGAAFYRRFCLWLGDFILHMEDEEQRIMPALQAAYDDDALLAVQGAIRGSVPPARMGEYLAWMLPSMSRAERLEMLGGMRQMAPPEAYAGAWAVAEATLQPADLEHLRAQLARPAAA